MAGVPRRESLALEDVTEMASATSALDLDALSIRVRKAADSPGDLLVEGRPTAAGVKLVLGSVERRFALLAFVCTGRRIVFILSRKGGFGPFVQNDSLLGSRQRSENRIRVGHE